MVLEPVWLKKQETLFGDWQWAPGRPVELGVSLEFLDGAFLEVWAQEGGQKQRHGLEFFILHCCRGHKVPTMRTGVCPVLWTWSSKVFLGRVGEWSCLEWQQGTGTECLSWKGCLRGPKWSGEFWNLERPKWKWKRSMSETVAKTRMDLFTIAKGVTFGM